MAPPQNTQHPKAMRPEDAEPTPDWNEQIFAEHWDGFKRVYSRSHQCYYDVFVDKMLE